MTRCTHLEAVSILEAPAPGPDLLGAGERPGDWPLARDPLALETSVPGLFAAGTSGTAP